MVFHINGKTLFEANKVGKLYLIEFDLVMPKIIANAATFETCHERFGHQALDKIKKMQKNNVVKGLEISEHEHRNCTDCAIGKCKRTTHQTKTTPREKRAGVSLHIDTAGPISPMSVGKSKYFVLCKDEASNYRQIAFVQSKDEIVDEVKQFISIAELETSNRVLKLNSDNGTEFLKLKQFLREQGIVHSLSTRYVAPQNGFIERDMRTVVEMSRTMLLKSGLPKAYWAEATNTAVYVLNRSISSLNENITPYEQWNG